MKETNQVCAILACIHLLDVNRGQDKEEESFIEQINNNMCTHTPLKEIHTNCYRIQKIKLLPSRLQSNTA